MKHKKTQPRKQKPRTKPPWRVARPHSMAIELGRAVYQMAKLNSKMDKLTTQLQPKESVDRADINNLEAIHDYSGSGGTDEQRAAVVLLDAILAAERDTCSTSKRRSKKGRRACPAERLEQEKHGVTIRRFQYAVRRYLSYRFPASWERILEEL
ncbi:hypothetical protein CLAFUW4_13432 [Fulvia fulva]|uniref:Uncharacterized protein n=1 Tax=Passalora fulva TaxID=5499 RepID=A0A9Q8PJL9_PASFU|nr:uncharacterized protein CLAFUR5_13286 [Fulvia fulva]KAK4611879.1 hypothetical protein CLAFUR4_13435 [Fulvia fulva]KAK4613156.1 hypothetical protein CLAFUR0_13443 [Fulvia fulva]UJO23700.1 hypothetical protein CLAFUR5_13286 [Fulvia fulva]WPV21198.1 hypothetical protein CLAFUW4_13432 [Fulvia fulva]WPV36270.1 hypothetical protein CLAFUW7_13439 [Fulvia fulva]